MATTASNYLIALDDGHGMGTAGKRTPIIPELGRAVHENEFNKAVVKIMDEMLRYIGFKTLLVAPTDLDTSLLARTNLANSKKASIYVSIHYDAMSGKWSTAEGNSIFIYPGNKNKASGKLADCIAGFLKQGTSQKWRGIKESDFHVLRATNMPAILSENGFMDNLREAKLMIDPNFQKEVATEHVQGICKYFGIPYKTKSITAAKPVITQIKKEATRMLNPSSSTLQGAVKTFLRDAVSNGHITQKWYDDYESGKLSLDDAFAIKLVVEQRSKK